MGQIFWANAVTPFNLLLGVLAVAVLATGSWRDALFGIVIVANSGVGMVQEVRAKRTLDRLAVLSAPRARVVRDGVIQEIPTVGVVLDDLLDLRAGDQLAADGVVRDAQCLEVNEALLTGESDHVLKRPGDSVLSGSIVMAGSGRCQVTAVGSSSFAGRISEEARRFTTTSSELVTGINRILRYVAVAIVFVGPVLFLSQRRSTATWQDAMEGLVAGLVGMVPEGLVLLTSVAFFAAALSLARRRVLVRELPAVEGLARVDVMCMDKTGTLTVGDMAFDHFERLGLEGLDVEDALGALAYHEDANATLRALRRSFRSPGWKRTGGVPFSSERKWSAARFEGRGIWVLGAPEVVAPHAAPDRAAELAAAGTRTLLLAHTAATLVGHLLPSELAPVALVALDETLRPDAAETLGYFKGQHIAVKIISGDNERTVGAVARRAGLRSRASPVDARDLPDGGCALGDALDRHDVFGRVVPDQKRAMVSALQRRGHVVAMTGDGVNDTLALKDADIGVAMGSGANATRSVAQLILLDNKFSVMPRVVSEGRRVIANVERVAALFLTKNVSSMLLSLCVALAGWPYPFLPRQVTLVSSLAIGVPGFFLALGPNSRRFEPGFVGRVLAFALPAGTVITVAVTTAYGLARADGLPVDEARTAATVVFLMASLAVLGIQARPLHAWKAGLVAAMCALGALAFALPSARSFFDLRPPPGPAFGRYLLLGLAASVGVELVSRFSAQASRR